MYYKTAITAVICFALFAPQTMAQTGLIETISSGKAYANFNLRYEGVDQNNALEDASALTLRTRLGYKTGTYNGFSALLEMEDSRIVAGVDEYTVGPTGFNLGQYSVIADPETTELDQAFLQYKDSKEQVTFKLGRQVITLDGHRFVGHVGWRQDRQTFDGATVKYTPLPKLTLNYGYINQRNRIFAERADINSKDHLFNAAYKTPLGTLTGYAYLLEVDNSTDNGLDTIGVSLKGSRKVQSDVSLSYALEYASQETDSAVSSFDTDYVLAEVGLGMPRVTIKLGFEQLGSDSGNIGFSTPLATLHKFNGWADQFLGTPQAGLQDTYVSLNGAVSGFNWRVAYHDFSTEESGAADDLGSEIDLLVLRKFSKNVTAGVKFASYGAGDAGAGKVDVNKMWAWISLGF